MNNFTLTRIKRVIEASLEERPTGDDWLDTRYDKQIITQGHTQPYYKTFFYLAQELKPKFVAILGGFQGTDAAHFAAGAPEATVVTIDHHADPGNEKDRAKMLEAVQQYPNIKYLRGWTTPGYAEEYPKQASDGFVPGSVFDNVKQILGDNKIDILVIDSWHEGKYFKRDWEYYSPLLASPALVICDDIFNAGHFVDMVETFESLPGEKLINTGVHSGIPMGFIKYEVKRTTTARKPRKKRTTTRKTA